MKVIFSDETGTQSFLLHKDTYEFLYNICMMSDKEFERMKNKLKN
jgi:hypothetical protein